MTRTTMALACALVFGVTLTVMGQTSSIPRTPWGDPDLQGTYTNSNEGLRGILSASRVAEREAGSSK